MRINKYISRCILGVTAIALWCFSFVLPARADICFLPTGICEQGALAKNAATKTCQDYINEGIYFDHEIPDMVCSLANVPGCSLYECTGKPCEARGYKLGPTNSTAEWPVGYTAPDWSCKWCKEGSKYKWLCTPREGGCPNGYTQNEANCPTGQQWEAVPAYGKCGNEACGECHTKVCPEGSTLGVEGGCKTCQEVENLGDGRICYKCHNMPQSYVTETQKNAEFDNSCYTFTTRVAADSSVCYKPEELECGVDQYKTEATISGKKMCKCYDYRYEFKLKNASDSNIVLTANGQSKLVGIVSQRCGDGCENWPYVEKIISGDNQLGIGQINNGTNLKIDGPINKSQTTDLNYKIKLTQTWGDEATIKELYINVRVEHDTCPENAPQFTEACQAGWKSKNDAMSVTGEKCFKCYNDTCSGSGFTNYGVGGSCPTPGNYDRHTTEYGSTCCKPKPDNCPGGYTNKGVGGSCPTDGNYYVQYTEFGSTCCMPKPDVCPGDYTKGATPTDGSYDTTTTEFGSNCYRKKSDECSGSQQKSCPCGVSSNGDKTPFGTQCYYCSPCCDVGANGAYDTPGLWGAACKEDTDCQSSSDYSLICVNKVNGCGECKECGQDDYLNGTIHDCKDKARREAKAFDWYYIRAKAGESCDAWIGDNCMKKDPHQTSACTGTQYPDVTHDSSDDPYTFNKCSESNDGDGAAECTASGECIFGSSVGAVGNGWFGEICRNDNDCFESSDFPLYCFEGQCLECDKYSTCAALADDETRFNNKYNKDIYYGNQLIYKKSTKELTCSAKDSSGVRHRGAGSTWTLQEYKDGYKERSYCTSSGECSQVNN